MRKIFIAGTSDFIGSFIVEEALYRGIETWAVIRRTSSREYLQDERIHFIELDFSSIDKLREQLSGYQFDCAVHVAGVTRCLNKEDFFRVNRDDTRNFVEALQALNQPLERFAFLSSLSIFGAIKEQQPYKKIESTDTPQLNTAYGKSKLEAEQPLPSSFPYIVLRPTGAYGPRERDYFLMAKSIEGHSDFAVGYKQRDITFVYVKDVVQATFLTLGHGKIGSTCFLSDRKVCQNIIFNDLIYEELGRPWWTCITAPIWVLRAITFFGDLIEHAAGRTSALNSDKHQILKQRNWRYSIHPVIEELGYKPGYDLRQGMKETIERYKKED